jgi:hypothetical protein
MTHGDTYFYTGYARAYGSFSVGAYKKQVSLVSPCVTSYTPLPLRIL